MTKFVQFIKFFVPALTENQCQDIFMNHTKRLQAMLLGTKPAEDMST